MKDPARLLEQGATAVEWSLLSAAAREEPPAGGAARLAAALGLSAVVVAAPSAAAAAPVAVVAAKGAAAGGGAVAGGGAFASGGAVGGSGAVGGGSAAVAAPAAKAALTTIGAKWGAWLGGALVAGALGARALSPQPSPAEHRADTQPAGAEARRPGTTRAAVAPRAPATAEVRRDVTGSAPPESVDPRPAAPAPRAAAAGATRRAPPTGARRAPESAAAAGVRDSSARSIEVEIQRLDVARRALRGGDTAAALGALDAYAAESPGGVLRQEAALIRIEALVAAGNPSAARQAAGRFLRRHPGTPHEARVRSLVGDGP